jgi:hypothetical protein
MELFNNLFSHNMARTNLINGQRPQFGNPEHIAWVKEKTEIMSGDYPVCEADWEFVRLGNRTTETRKPITYFEEPNNADAVQCYVPCPRCKRLHKHVVCYDPFEIDQTAVWAAIDETEITCWNCGLEMHITSDGSRNVYVTKNQL